MNNWNKPKPDDRSDNVDRIQKHIDNTVSRYREAEEMIKNSKDEKQRIELQAKNERRESALKGMRKEIRDEAVDKKNGYM